MNRNTLSWVLVFTWTCLLMVDEANPTILTPLSKIALFLFSFIQIMVNFGAQSRTG